MIVDPARCPLCGEPNACELAGGRTRCWCFETPVPAETLARVPAEARDLACVCRPCATGSTDEERRRRHALRWTRR